MMKQLLKGALAIMLTLVSYGVFAQGVTTATIRGTVVDEKGESLPGATIVAVHEPSGTTYGTVTGNNGSFTLPNLRTGGPYTVSVSFVGYPKTVEQGIFLNLGQVFVSSFTLKEAAQELSEVIVTGVKDPLINNEKNGASTNLSDETINALPTINRSINDFTRLTPQSNGTAFAGRDNRFNNYTIDGNILNNNFGLGASQFAGGNPVSIDAIQEIQVNLAPFDVRQGGFTGANVNAITRSGTNTFTGSVYGFYRNQNTQGTRIGEQELTADDSFNRILGARVGGPIIKDKLFFFASFETEEEAVPSFQKRANRPGENFQGSNVISRVPVAVAQDVRDQLQSLYGYDAGAFEDYDFASQAQRLNLRLDYNINRNHKFTLRYNRFNSFRDVPVNTRSYGALNGIITQTPANVLRTDVTALNFRNSHYTVNTTINALVAELNSTIGNNMANSLNIGYTSVADPRRGIPGGQDFPFIEVLEEGTYYMTIGNELFSVGNAVDNNIFNITNNLSIFKGKHTITAGFNFEFMTFENFFNPHYNSVYRFNSFDNFYEAVINRNPNIAPDAFAISYTRTGAPAADETRFAQLGLYVQDEIDVLKNLRVTAGLRIDVPFYPIDLPGNPLLDALDFVNPIDGQPIKADVSLLPKTSILWSPRVGFNWDVNGDKKTQVRGGTGVFSGRLPFVWISNQINNNGVNRTLIGLQGDAVGDIRFNPDVNAYRPTGEVQPVLSSVVNFTNPDFRLPQVWRSNLAVDQVLPGGFVATLEGIYTRDLNNVFPVDVNMAPATRVYGGIDQRPFYLNNNELRINPQISNALMLGNNQVGSYAAITAQIQKSFANGFFTSVAYTRSVARDFGLTGGSTGGSLFTDIVRDDRNNPEVSFTRFDQPNRIVGAVSYNKTYLNGLFGSTISLFYNGGENGRFSYTYGGNIAGDASLRTLYIPTREEVNQINFLPYTNNAGQANEVTFTAQQQRDAFNAFIDNSRYLSSRRGEIAERNAAKNPWLHRFDFRFLQDIYLAKDPNKHRLQISVDILNFGNVFNSEWGVAQVPVLTAPLAYASRTLNDGVYTPNFRFPTDPRNNTQLLTEEYRPIIGLSQTWSMQLGVRYIFN